MLFGVNWRQLDFYKWVFLVLIMEIEKSEIIMFRYVLIMGSISSQGVTLCSIFLCCDKVIPNKVILTLK